MSGESNTEYLPKVCGTCRYCRSRSKSTEDKQIGYFCELTGRMITWPNYEICLCYECKFHAREERE